VTLTGMLTEKNGTRALFVPAAELGGTVKPKEAPDVSSQPRR